MTTFYENQIQKGMSFKTAGQQESSVERFLEWCKVKKISAKTITYAQVMNYIDHLKTLGNKRETIRFKVKTLEHYFEFLEVKINVAIHIKIKGGIRKLIHTQLEKEEIEAIFEAQKTYGLVNKRNQIVLSLLIFQGIQSEDLARILCEHVDLKKARIFVPGSRFLNERFLPLSHVQILLFHDYLINIRPALLQGKLDETEQFIVNLKGKKHDVKGLIFHILKPLKIEFPKLKNSIHLRQNLIVNWIKTEGLRKAQYLAGHKFVSSTERYNEDRNEELKAEIAIFHPF